MVSKKGTVKGMKWLEVRKLYPNQFVKLKVLSSHIDNDQEFIDDIAIINQYQMN
ncbi:hypothetical protein [Terrilactibacillus laevilacticus]|uniref:hypothetical protein n=1 Tax=Terrilactibacillus laevilacticus TaxID=1380157 RepID=UPI00319E6F48